MLPCTTFRYHPFPHHHLCPPWEPRGTLFSNYITNVIMTLNRLLNTSLNTTQTQSTPDISNFKRTTSLLKIRDFAPLDVPLCCVIKCVQSKDESASCEFTAPVLGRVGGIESPCE
jgi:hypothetical protein